MLITLQISQARKIKTASDGLPRLYKARMVARGFSQIKGLEYDESFSPVAPYTAVRALLVIAAANGWHAHATDFTQAYLNGRLEHAVYMKPPAGAPLPPPGKVYQIVKGLYGLKQSGRVWHQHLDRLLRKIGFLALASAPCVYSKGSGDSTVAVAAYVDDLVLVSPAPHLIEEVKKLLDAVVRMPRL